MELNVSEILSSTLAEMEQSGEAEKHVREIFRKAVFSALDDVLNGYKIRSAIEKRLEEKLPEIVEDIGLDGYAAYIAQAAKSIVDSVQAEDIRKKANAVMQTTLLTKRESIKISEIIEAFAEEVKRFDDDVRREHDAFDVQINNRDACVGYGNRHYDISLKYNEDDGIDSLTARFGMMYKPGESTRIAHLELNGHNIDGKIGFRNLDDFSALLLSCYFNKTPVEIDVTDSDAVDTSVWDEDY